MTDALADFDSTPNSAKTLKILGLFQKDLFLEKALFFAKQYQDFCRTTFDTGVAARTKAIIDFGDAVYQF